MHMHMHAQTAPKCDHRGHILNVTERRWKSVIYFALNSTKTASELNAGANVTYLLRPSFLCLIH